ncbi:MAG: hypothetical protein ACLSCQ_03130 [Evtepia gabavorous]
MMNYSISDTAEYGEYVSGSRILPYEQTKANMKAVLNDIQDGTFAGKWIAENKNGRTFFNSKRALLAKHPMETVGAELRKNMLWGTTRTPTPLPTKIEEPPRRMPSAAPRRPALPSSDGRAGFGFVEYACCGGKEIVMVTKNNVCKTGKGVL